MSKVININFDATKLDKTLMENGKYVKLDIIPLKEPKVKTKQDGTPIVGDGWKLMKTHLVIQSNKDKTGNMPIIGEGTCFDDSPVEEKTEDSIQEDQIPF